MKQFDKDWLLNKNKKSIFNYGYSYPEPEVVVEDIIKVVEKEIEYLKARKKGYVLRSRNLFNKMTNQITGLVLDKEMERWNGLLLILKTQLNEIKMSEVLEGEAMANSGQMDIDNHV